MQSNIQRRQGRPSEVLQTVDVAEPTAAPPGAVLIRVSLTPNHRGDLQAVAAARNFGDPVEIHEGGRVPGRERVSTVVAVGEDVDPGTDSAVGDRVALLMAQCSWSEVIAVPTGQLVGVPDTIAEDVAAHMLVNAFTAQRIVPAPHESLREEECLDVASVQAGAGSAFGRLITTELIRRGVHAVRLVRSSDSADWLRRVRPGRPVGATDDTN